MKKSVLIISFTLPPYPGIGGRRWAKFAKELNKQNHDIRVITFDYGKPQQNANWVKDTSGYLDRIEKLSSGYPNWLQTPSTLKEKLFYRLSLAYVKLLTKGNYYDKSSFAKHSIQKKTLYWLKKGYSNIIVTCAPFKLAVWVAELKIQHPEINLIVDFRDPWVDNKVLYGLHNMSSKRQKFEIESEKFVINEADAVLTVAEEMTAYFKSLSLNPDTYFLTVPNGFDPDDFEFNSGKSADNKDTIKFIFVGTLYEKAQHHFVNLLKALDILQKSNIKIYNLLKFDFYGSFPNELQDYSKQHPSVNFHKSISNSLIYKKIQNSDICMTFLTDEITYCFNTKFFEYLSQQKPIAIFSKKGSASEFILNNNLGYVIEPDAVIEQLTKIYNDYKNGNLLHNPTFDIAEHSVKHIVNKIIPLLK